MDENELKEVEEYFSATEIFIAQNMIAYVKELGFCNLKLEMVNYRELASACELGTCVADNCEDKLSHDELCEEIPTFVFEPLENKSADHTVTDEFLWHRMEAWEVIRKNNWNGLVTDFRNHDNANGIAGSLKFQPITVKRLGTVILIPKSLW